MAHTTLRHVHSLAVAHPFPSHRHIPNAITSHRHLARAVSRLVTPDGKILVPGLDKLVAPLTEDERKRYDEIDVTMKVSRNVVDFCRSP